MSNVENLLRQTIDASLQQTAASKEVSNEVRGKMAQIDQKADQAIADFEAAFPSEFNRHTKRQVFIDPVNGRDVPNASVYKTILYGLTDNSFVQALFITLSGDVEFKSSYLVTNRYLSINLGGHTLTRTTHSAMFNGELNVFCKIYGGMLNFDLLQPKLVNPHSGLAPFFYTVDTAMTLLLGDRDGWNAAGSYLGGLTVRSNSPHLISAVGSHIDYRTHSCRFELQGGATTCNVIYASSGGSIDQYASYNVAADVGFSWDYSAA